MDTVLSVEKKNAASIQVMLAETEAEFEKKRVETSSAFDLINAKINDAELKLKLLIEEKTCIEKKREKNATKRRETIGSMKALLRTLESSPQPGRSSSEPILVDEDGDNMALRSPTRPTRPSSPTRSALSVSHPLPSSSPETVQASLTTNSTRPKGFPKQLPPVLPSLRPSRASSSKMESLIALLVPLEELKVTKKATWYHLTPCPVIVSFDLGESWHEIACCHCKANATAGKLFFGLLGLLRHFQQHHSDAPEFVEIDVIRGERRHNMWAKFVADECVVRELDESQVRELSGGTVTIDVVPPPYI